MTAPLVDLLANLMKKAVTMLLTKSGFFVKHDKTKSEILASGYMLCRCATNES